MIPRSTSVNSDAFGSQMTPLFLCMGSACYHHGAPEILKIIQEKLDKYGLTTEVELMGHFCLGNCNKAVLMRYEEHTFEDISPENAADVFEQDILPRLIEK